eukprot:763612-Hanusia_phi.AAC.4
MYSEGLNGHGLASSLVYRRQRVTSSGGAVVSRARPTRPGAGSLGSVADRTVPGHGHSDSRCQVLLVPRLFSGVMKDSTVFFITRSGSTFRSQYVDYPMIMDLTVLP